MAAAGAEVGLDAEIAEAEGEEDVEVAVLAAAWAVVAGLGHSAPASRAARLST